MSNLSKIKRSREGSIEMKDLYLIKSEGDIKVATKGDVVEFIVSEIINGELIDSDDIQELAEKVEEAIIDIDVYQCVVGGKNFLVATRKLDDYDEDEDCFPYVEMIARREFSPEDSSRILEDHDYEEVSPYDEPVSDISESDLDNIIIFKEWF